MSDVPRSDIFDDVYFSADNGLEETMHVFVQGNDLPARIQDVSRFTIGETGFGTGLNFLCAWKVFEENARAGAILDYVSFEKYPLTPDTIRASLKPFAGHLSPYIEKMLQVYPQQIPGFHRVYLGDTVRLTLVFDDVNNAMQEMEACVDAWFLDGFTPAKNPQMWSEEVFSQIARLSASGATFATFTAAGLVKRGLEKAGFDVEKCKGYGRKRDMLRGSRTAGQHFENPDIKTVAIIGGGLAGTSCAYFLKKHGIIPIIYEQGNTLAAEASGNPAGLYNPRFSANRSVDSDFYAAAFARCLQFFPLFDDIDFCPVGALHLMNTPEKEKRFHAMDTNWGWPKDMMQVVSSMEASEIAGIKMDYPALYLPHSGSVNPAKLCHAYARDVEVRLNTPIDDIQKIHADGIIFANGLASKNFISDLPVHGVRGQVTSIQATNLSEKLRCNIHYGGYLAKALNGQHMVGATFQKWLDTSYPLPQDNLDNIEKLKGSIPSLSSENFFVLADRVGFRTASHDRFPIIGAAFGQKNVYISTAHASHGIVSSLAGAMLLADVLSGAPRSLSLSSQKMLSNQRFIDRDARRNTA